MYVFLDSIKKHPHYVREYIKKHFEDIIEEAGDSDRIVFQFEKY